MAQHRHRPTVSLTLDPETVKAARSIVERLPGLTLSGLVDHQLRLFVANMAPLIAELEAATDEVQRVRIMQAMFGQQVVALSDAFNEGLARTNQEKNQGG